MNIWEYIGWIIAYCLSVFGLMCLLLIAEDCLGKLDRKRRTTDNEK